MTDIEITHTHEDGTLLAGSSKGDGVYEIVKRHGFAYFPSIRAIGIRQSRDQVAKRYQINAAAEALRAAGHDVTVAINDTPRARGTVLADQADRLDDRADRLTAAAARHAGAADAAYNRADAISARFEGGQPILVGHHSERGARRDQQRIDDAMRKSVVETREAERIAHAASRVGKDAAVAARPAQTARRIKTTESELRVIQRDLDGYTRRHLDGQGNPVYVFGHDPAAGNHREVLLARQALLNERLAFDQAALAQAEAAGYVVWGPHNVHPGDLVRCWVGRSVEVLKVNKVTVTVPSGYSWTHKVKFTDISHVECTHGHPAAPPPLDEVTRIAVSEPVVVKPTGRTPEQDARIAQALAAPAISAFGYFPTPAALAEQVVQDYTGLADGGPVTVLEPSAGDGRIVRAVLSANPQAHVTAIEPNTVLVGLISEGVDLDQLSLHCCSLEEYAVSDRRDPAARFDLVVMNPPFSAPGHPVLWAEHVLTAVSMLAPGGRLVAIAPAGFEYGQDRRVKEVRDLVNALGGWKPLPEGSFTTSGTEVRVGVMWLDAPAALPAGDAPVSPQIGL